MDARSLTLLLAIAAGGPGLASCHDSGSAGINRDGQVASTGARSATAGPKDGAELAAWRVALLDRAYAATSALPVDPHLKTRSLGQSEVVEASLELDRPDLAENYLEGIDNWRRGSALAALALHKVRNGEREGIQEMLERAEKLGRDPGHQESFQAWRRDRVLAAIARVRMLLGEQEEVARLSKGLQDSELGALQLQRAEGLAAEEFEVELVQIDQALVSSNFDQMKGILRACVELFDRFYEDPKRRDLAQERVEIGYERLPIGIRIELMIALCEVSIRRKDQDKAGELIDRTEAFLGIGHWLAEHKVPLMARLAGLRHAAGQRERARRQVRQSWRLYRKELGTIVDMFRVEALLPLAEAWVRIGNEDRARAIYARALQEATINPNSRPRAMDLMRICCSLARQGIEPGEALDRRLAQVHQGLRDPW